MNLTLLSQEINTIARQAGAFIRQESLAFDRHATEYKDVNNLVSYVDKETEKRLVDALHTLLPEAGFITEEGTTGTEADKGGLNWIIDPLDGTANFIHGLPVFSVSVALAEGRQSLAGVVYDVPRDECFSAWQGGGAFVSRHGAADEKLSVSPAATLGESLIATGFPYYSFEEMQNYLHILESLMQQTHGLRRMGSAAIDLAYVACGRFEGFYEYNLNSWDMAAGALLVQEAGGTVTDFTGGTEFLFRGDVVAGGPAHRALLDEIQKFWT
ncbi:MAG: inositol monophosphatase [Bacteroidetes bacterium]|nr:inositol monophosphatase [Fibrella sp.]